MRLILLFCILIINYLQSQKSNFYGIVVDQNDNSLQNVSIIIDSNIQKASFTFSDSKGNFKASLSNKLDYRITFSSLGYKPLTIDVNINTDYYQKIVLELFSNELDEILIEYKPPIEIKQDTIIYNIEKFVDGNEDKLKDIIKKLPGLEVDNIGNITVKGKKVEKVLVENKEFFTGDSKLASNNIPANAIDKIEIFEKYNESNLISKLEDIENIALNVKLKSDKNKFIFGDIRIGTDLHKNYLLNPTIFYYSPKNRVYSINDLNNIGKSSFTLKDYLEIEGGNKKLMNDAKGYFSLINDSFSKFLNTNDFYYSKNIFNSISYSKTINPKADIQSYLINVKRNDSLYFNKQNNYLAFDNMIENRIDETELNSNIFLGKIKYTYKNSKSEIFSDLLFKLNSNNSNSSFNIENSFINRLLQNISRTEKNEYFYNFNYIKFLSKSHTLNVVFNSGLINSVEKNNWMSNSVNSFSNLLNLIPTPIVDVRKHFIYDNGNFNFLIKDYWQLNNLNHIYITIGYNYKNENAISSENQIIDNNLIFEIENFGYEVANSYHDIYCQVNYTKKYKKTIFKVYLNFHKYYYEQLQKTSNINLNISNILPWFQFNHNFTTSKKFVFKYEMKNRFPHFNQFIDNFSIQNFNNVYIGNSTLNIEKFNYFDLNYSNFNFRKGLFWGFGMNFRNMLMNIKNSIISQNLDFFNTPVLSDFLDNSLNVTSSFSKKTKTIKFGLNFNVNFSEYEKPFNDLIVFNRSNNYFSSFFINTNFEGSVPNFEFSYSKNYSNYISENKIILNNDVFAINVIYNISNFLEFKGNYLFEIFENKSSKNTNYFNLASVSLKHYFNDKRKTSIDFNVNNLFNLNFRQTEFFDGVSASIDKRQLVPRYFILSFNYKI